MKLAFTCWRLGLCFRIDRNSYNDDAHVNVNVLKFGRKPYFLII